MALITRVTRLFKADFNAVLDHLEEPAMLLKHAVREMEDSLNDAQRKLQISLAERADRQSTLSEIEQKLLELQAELDICFEAREEVLARDLIKRQLEARQMSAFMARKISALDARNIQQQKNLKENQASLLGLKQKAALLTGENVSVSDVGMTGCAGEWHTDPLTVSDNDVEVAFLMEKKRRSPV